LGPTIGIRPSDAVSTGNRTGCIRPMMAARRFPPPWSIDELEECFVVKDQNGQQLAYVYFEDEPGRLQHDGDERGRRNK
jgi:hypothetical protein